MITFRWARGGTFIVLKDKEEIGTLNPVTKKKSSVSFNSDFKDDREEEKKKMDKPDLSVLHKHIKEVPTTMAVSLVTLWSSWAFLCLCHF